jgi:hypothetical protein
MSVLTAARSIPRYHDFKTRGKAGLNGRYLFMLSA